MEWRKIEWTRFIITSFEQVVMECSSYFLCVLGFFPIQVALGNDYVAQVDKHSSQKDASKGFGGKFGVEKDRVDKVGTQFQDMCKQLHVAVLKYGKYGVSKTVLLCL